MFFFVSLLNIKDNEIHVIKKKFKLNIENSQNNTPNSITPMLNSHEIKSLRGPMVERSFTP